MNSIIITAYKEAKTIGKAIESINQNNKHEILCVCPDKDIETKEVIQKYIKRFKNIRYVEDPGEGKPEALNIAMKKAKGEILILTDGDVFVDKGAIKEILKPFQDRKVGIVSGRPISLNSRKNKWGFFSHLLTDLGAHDTRMKQRKNQNMIVCSGYLYAFRKKLIKRLPKDALSEDALISHLINDQGYKTIYAPKAKVYVKYPTNLKDWVIQKKRSAGGYNQLKLYTKNKERMRSFTKESLGIFKVFSYAKSLNEFIWTIDLIFLRLYLWFLIYKDINIKKKGLKSIWLRPASTK